jgi:hypothetical protein
MLKIRSAVSGDITLLKIESEVNLDELHAYLAGHYAATPTRCMVWDVSAAAATRHTSSDAEQLTTLLALLPNADSCETAAIIAPDDVQYGMSRMFGAYAESKGLVRNLGIFRSVEEAEAWLGVKLPVLA